MGQYYHALTINESESKVWSLQCTHFNNTRDFDYYVGLKLMEHSYYRNILTDAMSGYLYHNPTRLYWVGDYSSDIKPRICDKTWGKNASEYHFEIQPKFDYNNKWFVNHTKKQGFKLLEPHQMLTLEIYPISLLTAVGNGRGGGDYFGKNKEQVGIWAGNIVSIEDNLPDDYKAIPYPAFAR